MSRSFFKVSKFFLLVLVAVLAMACDPTITIPLTGLSARTPEINLVIGEGSKDFIVDPVPSDTTEDYSVTLSSSNEAVARIVSGKVAPGTTAGRATITATSTVHPEIKTTGTAIVSNRVVPLTGLSARTPEINLVIGEGSKDFIVDPVPSDTTEDYSVTLSSSNEAVARIVSGKVAPGTTAGRATITATSTVHPEIKTTGTAIVSNRVVPLTGLSARTPEINLVIGEGSKDFIVDPVPSDTTEDYSVTLSSSNEAVARIVSGKVAPGTTAGRATITATSTVHPEIKTTGTAIVSGPYSVTFNDFPDLYYGGSPSYVDFSGTLHSGSKETIALEVFLRDKTTKVGTVESFPQEGTWAKTFRVTPAVYYLVIKATARDGTVAWSEERILLVGISYIFSFNSLGELWKANMRYHENWSFDQSLGTNFSIAIVAENNIFAYNKTTWQISSKKLKNTTWIRDLTTKEGLISMNFYGDYLYGYFTDGKIWKKNTLVNNSLWQLTDSLSDTSFSSVVVLGNTAFGVKGDDYLWSKDLTIEGSPYTKKCQIYNAGVKIEGLKKIGTFDVDAIVVYSENTRNCYSSYLFLDDSWSITAGNQIDGTIQSISTN